MAEKACERAEEDSEAMTRAGVFSFTFTHHPIHGNTYAGEGHLTAWGQEQFRRAGIDTLLAKLKVSKGRILPHSSTIVRKSKMIQKLHNTL